MKNGFYAVSFSTPLGAGNGIAFVQDGIIRGGDSSIYYLGNYNVDSNAVAAEVTTNRHAAGLASIFGKDNVHITLSGTFSDTDANLTGSAPEAPGIQVALKRIGD